MLVLLYLNLFTVRSTTAIVAGRYSSGYVVALIAGALTCAVAFQLSRGGAGRWSMSALAPRLGVAGAALPWVVVAVALGFAGQLWWFQRAWQLRLFVTYALACWTLALLVQQGTSRSGGSAVMLWAVGGSAVLAGIQGLSLATWPFSMAVSALMLGAGFTMWTIAARGRPSTQLRAAVVTGATLLALIVGEAAFRIMGVGADASTLLDPTVARRLHHNPAAGSAVINQPNRLDEFAPVLVQVNSAGIRGPEPPPRADILIIGDSFVQAVQVPWEKTVAPLLETRLRQRGIHARVISHGVLSWSPLLEWNWYLKEGRKYRASTVVLFFFWNDLWTVGSEVETHRAVMGPDGRPAYFDVNVGSARLWHRYLRVTQVAERIARNVGNLRLQRTVASTTAVSSGPLDEAAARQVALSMVGRDTLLRSDQVQRLLHEPLDQLPGELKILATTKFWPVMRPMRLWWTEQERAAARSADVLTRFADDVRADGARFVVLYVPNPMQVSTRDCTVGRYFDRVPDDVVLPVDSGLQEWLRRTSAGVATFDLYDPLPDMRARAHADLASRPLYLRYDCHWSEAGHAFMANWLAARLTDSRPGTSDK